MAEETCPNCGCFIDPVTSYKHEGVVYCCESCALEDSCDCGCQ